MRMQDWCSYLAFTLSGKMRLERMVSKPSVNRFGERSIVSGTYFLGVICNHIAVTFGVEVIMTLRICVS